MEQLVDFPAKQDNLDWHFCALSVWTINHTISAVSEHESHLHELFHYLEPCLMAGANFGVSAGEW